MKRLWKVSQLFVTLLWGTVAFAQERTHTETSDFTPRISMKAEKIISKKKLSVSIDEEVRFMSNCTEFDKLYSTLELSYTPTNWLKIAPEYTFIADQDTKKATDLKQWKTRHRLAVNIEGFLNMGQWEFSLRERPQVHIRTDSLNVCEKMKAAFVLRSRLKAQYKFFHLPLKLYALVEMTHTLNTPDRFIGLEDKKSDEISFKLDNYISKMRYSVGSQYRIDRRNYIELYYRLDDGVDYDIHITKNKGYLKEVKKETYLYHIVGLAYKFRF